MEGETGWDTQILDYTYHDFELIVCSVLIFDLLDELWEDLLLKYLLKYIGIGRAFKTPIHTLKYRMKLYQTKKKSDAINLQSQVCVYNLQQLIEENLETQSIHL